MGARIETRPFTNYADQRNFALGLSRLFEWAVMLDADERMTPPLAREIEQRLAEPTDAVMFCVRRRDIFLGRWLRHASGYPTWFPRVFLRHRVRVEREVNESYQADGRTQRLEGHLEHHPFNKGLDWWIERHNRYSTMEADLLSRAGNAPQPSFAAMCSRDPLQRRAALKALAYKQPARPFLIFIYLYIFRLGFLDGRAGLQFASLRLAYELMIDAKLATRKWHARGEDACDRGYLAPRLSRK
jgi:hypothetical protein